MPCNERVNVIQPYHCQCGQLRIHGKPKELHRGGNERHVAVKLNRGHIFLHDLFVALGSFLFRWLLLLRDALCWLDCASLIQRFCTLYLPTWCRYSSLFNAVSVYFFLSMLPRLVLS